MGIIDINSKEEFETCIKKDSVAVLHFYAEWADKCKHMNDVLLELSSKPDLQDVLFAKLLAEDLPDLSLALKVEAVPTFIIFSRGKEVDRVNGANAGELTHKVTQQALKFESTKNSQKPISLETRLKLLIGSCPVMLFMKGDPKEPRCGFSKQIIQILNDQTVNYKTFDILQDQEVREGLKKFSNWPTYPQLYVNGELVGGLDIVKELVASGEFKQMLPKTLEDRLAELVKKERVMLFMKGTPEMPRCGFSKEIVQILNSTKVKYGSFDILEDEEVRQGLKEWSDWPTYPQLYVNGELVGGVDIVKELNESGDLIATLNSKSK